MDTHKTRGRQTWPQASTWADMRLTTSCKSNQQVAVACGRVALEASSFSDDRARLQTRPLHQVKILTVITFPVSPWLSALTCPRDRPLL